MTDQTATQAISDERGWGLPKEQSERSAIYERNLNRAWRLAKIYLVDDIGVGKKFYADDVYKWLRHTVHQMATELTTAEERQRFVATYVEPQHRSLTDRFHYCQACRDYGLWNEPRFFCATWVTEAYRQ